MARSAKEELRQQGVPKGIGRARRTAESAQATANIARTEPLHGSRLVPATVTQGHVPNGAINPVGYEHIAVGGVTQGNLPNGAINPTGYEHIAVGGVTQGNVLGQSINAAGYNHVATQGIDPVHVSGQAINAVGYNHVRTAGITQGHVAGGAINATGYNHVAADGINGNHLHPSLFNPATNVHGIRTVGVNVTNGAAHFIHAHSVSFKHLPRAERRHLLGLRDKVRRHRSIKGGPTPDNFAALLEQLQETRELALASFRMQADDEDMTAEGREELLDRDDEDARKYKNHHAMDDWQYEYDVPHDLRDLMRGRKNA